MFLSAEELTKRLGSPDNLIRRLEERQKIEQEQELCAKVEPKYQTQNHGEALSEEMKVVVGVAAHFDTAKNVAEEFGISERTVYVHKHGRMRGDENVEGINQERLDKIKTSVEGKKADAIDKALDKIVSSIEAISGGDKVARNYSAIAGQLSGVVRNLTGADRNGAGVGNAVQIIIQSPGRKTVEDYDVIEA